jgi:hypothetical protein
MLHRSRSGLRTGFPEGRASATIGRLADIPAYTTGEVRPASHILEYFDPPQSRRTVCRCPSVRLHFADPPLEGVDSNHLSLMDGAVDLRQLPGLGAIAGRCNPSQGSRRVPFWLAWQRVGAGLSAEIHRIDAQQRKAGHQRGGFVEVPAKRSS